MVFYSHKNYKNEIFKNADDGSFNHPTDIVSDKPGKYTMCGLDLTAVKNK
jgi:hypothetical protein